MQEQLLNERSPSRRPQSDSRLSTNGPAQANQQQLSQGMSTEELKN